MKNKIRREAGRQMKYVRVMLGILAAVIAAGAVWLTMQCRGQLPILLSAPEEAQQQAEATVRALCTGEYADAEKRLYGMPDLGADTQPEDKVNRMIWKAYRSSLDYQMVDSVYATQQGLAQKVKIISMELPSATEKLGQRAQVLLQQRVENARDVSEIYDADNTYRDAFVADILEDAVRQALEEDVRYTYQIIELQLVYREGQWWVLPDKALLNAVFGGVTG